MELSSRDAYESMRRLEEGDPHAGHELWALISGQLAKMRAAGQLACRDDVIQEVLIGLLRAWRNGKIQRDRFAGFTWRLTRRRLCDALAQQTCTHRDALHADPDTTHGYPPPSPCHELLLDLQRALDHLRPTHQRAITEIYLAGRTYTEAAQRLAIPLGTLKRRQTHGLRELRRHMQ